MLGDRTISGFERDYYVRRDNTRGTSYPCPVSPWPDECVQDLLIRAACEHGFSPRVSYQRLGIATMPAVDEWPRKITTEALATLLGNPGGPEELEALFAAGPPPKPGLRPLLGVWLEKATLTRRRRLSPLALCKAPYLRAVWHVWPLSFDPETKEYLLQVCPVCDKPLGTNFMGDIWCCDRCSRIERDGKLIAVDLRRYPQDLVDERLWELLDFGTSFVDPNATARRKVSRSQLHSDFHHLHDGAVFDFIATLGRRLMKVPVDKKTMIGIPPPALAEAAKTVLGWPEAFESLISKYKSNGYLEYFHPFGAALFFNPRLDRGLRERMKDIARLYFARPVIQASGGDIGRRIDRSEYAGLRLRRSKAAVQLNQSSIGTLLAARLRSRRDVRLFSQAVGVSVPTLIDMAEDELIPSAFLADEAASDFVAHAQNFIRRVKSTSRSYDVPYDAMRLPKAVAALLARVGDPWPNLFKMMFEGRLPFWLTREARRGIVESIYVNDIAMLSIILASEQRTIDPHYVTELSAREASSWTRLWQQRPKAEQAGLLGKPYTRASLGGFNTAFETSGSIQLRLRIGTGMPFFPNTRASLEAAGIAPVLEIAGGVWRRSEVDAHFGTQIAPSIV